MNWRDSFSCYALAVEAVSRIDGLNSFAEGIDKFVNADNAADQAAAAGQIAVTIPTPLRSHDLTQFWLSLGGYLFPALC